MDVFVRIPVPPARPVILAPPARTHSVALLLLWFVTVSCCLPRAVLLKTCALVRTQLANYPITYQPNNISAFRFLLLRFWLGGVMEKGGSRRFWGLGGDYRGGTISNRKLKSDMSTVDCTT